MNKLIRAGIREQMPAHLRDRVLIANQVALLLVLVSAFYVVFSLLFYPQLAVYPSLAVVVCMVAIGLNYLGEYDASRFIISTVLLLLATVYHGFLVQEGEPLLTAMVVLQLCLSVIPWVVIDLSERPLLITVLSICYFMLFTQGFINDVLVMELDNSAFRSGFMYYVSYGFGVLILVLSLGFMQVKHFVAEGNNRKLMDQINEKSSEMERKQQELKRSLDELNRAREEDEKRTWIANGLSEMNDILRNSHTDALYQKLIKGIVQYLGVIQGGMYIEKEDEEGEKYLKLEACYAFDRIKFINQRIEIGEGLVGQCYLEKEKIILKQVPEDYVRITSGLGDAPPGYVSIVPIKNEDELRGILEFASFKPLDDHELLFLEKLAESLTVFIANYMINEQTRQLLEQSQLQTEQLRAQEEEMRQNMEEMQATQEEMHRKENEYIERITELEKLQTAN